MSDSKRWTFTVEMPADLPDPAGYMGTVLLDIFRRFGVRVTDVREPSTAKPIRLRGGPLDGAEVADIGWVEAIVLRTDTGLHWYVYTGVPPEADEGHDGVLEHHADETFEKAIPQGVDVKTGETTLEGHRRNIAYALAELRASMPTKPQPENQHG